MQARTLQRGPSSFETPLARLLRMRGGRLNWVSPKATRPARNHGSIDVTSR
jgi:hypothetical protein